MRCRFSWVEARGRSRAAARSGAQPMPPEVPAGLPAALLERRPDVLAAEEALHAQTARIGAAQAARLPTLSLTASRGRRQPGSGEVLHARALVLERCRRTSGPLLEFGKRKSLSRWSGRAPSRRCRYYEQAVLQAFREVEDALVSVRTSRERHMALQRQVSRPRGRSPCHNRATRAGSPVTSRCSTRSAPTSNRACKNR